MALPQIQIGEGMLGEAMLAELIRLTRSMVRVSGFMVVSHS